MQITLRIETKRIKKFSTYLTGERMPKSSGKNFQVYRRLRHAEDGEDVIVVAGIRLWGCRVPSQWMTLGLSRARGNEENPPCNAFSIIFSLCRYVSETHGRSF
jgi:hypothetical protein